MHVSPSPDYDKKMTVHIIANIATKDELHRILQGWQDHMSSPDGAQWLGDRLRGAGVAVGPPGDDAIADDGPDGAGLSAHARPRLRAAPRPTWG